MDPQHQLRRTFWEPLTTDEKFEHSSSSDADGWPKLYRRFRDLDDETIRSWKEDIDTLLVFTGLFSAVVTAFVVAFYSTLQESPSDITNIVLVQISQQLNSFTQVSPFVNSTQQFAPPQSSFQPSSTVVRANALWFVSLLFSLTTASLAMLVKQWLREYMLLNHVSAAERCRVRHFRHKGLVKWRVFELAALLPQLLQVALILFLIGLRDFAHILNPTIEWIVTAVLAVFLTAYAFVTLAPAISASCPYKTPLLKRPLDLVRRWKDKVLSVIWSSPLPSPHEDDPGSKGYVGRDRTLDIGVILEADKAFLDPTLFESYRICLHEHKPLPSRQTNSSLADKKGNHAKNRTMKLHKARMGTKALIPCLYTMARRRHKVDEPRSSVQSHSSSISTVSKWESISDFIIPANGSELWDGLDVSQSVIWMLIDALRLDIHTIHVTHTLNIQPDESFFAAARLVLIHGNQSQLLAMKPLMTWLITVSTSVQSALGILSSYVKAREHTHEYTAIPVVLIQSHLVDVIQTCRDAMIPSQAKEKQQLKTTPPLVEGPVVLFMTLCLIVEIADEETSQQCHKLLSTLSRDVAPLLDLYLRETFEDYPGRGQQQIYHMMQPILRLRRQIPGIVDESLIAVLKGCFGHFLSLKGLTFSEDHWVKWMGDSDEGLLQEPYTYNSPSSSVPNG